MTKTYFNLDDTNKGVEGWYGIHNGVLVIYFKPTNSDYDWKTNFSFWPKKWCGHLAHGGYVTESLKAIEVVSAIIWKHPLMPVEFAGRSYGGPIAEAMGKYFEHPAFNISGAMFFLSNRVVRKHVTKLWNRGDIVPFMPPCFNGKPHTKVIRGKWRVFWKAHADYNVDSFIEKYLDGNL